MNCKDFGFLEIPLVFKVSGTKDDGCLSTQCEFPSSSEANRRKPGISNQA